MRGSEREEEEEGEEKKGANYHSYNCPAHLSQSFDLHVVLNKD
jgi:hypothetical protein